MGKIVRAIILCFVFCGQLFAGQGGDVRKYSDPSTPIEVRAGEEFIIALEANRTTGYQWQLSVEPDRSVVQLESVEYHVSQPGLVGTGGTEFWRFKSLGQGKTTVVLIYVRPWEKDVPPVKFSTFTVIVHR